GDPLGKVFEAAHAAGGDHRHRHRVRHPPGESEVEAVAGAVPVHAGQQDLPGAVVRHAPGPVDGVDAGRPAAAVGEDLPRGSLGAGHLPGVDGDHNALGTEMPACLGHELGPRHRGGVDRYLVRAGRQHAVNVVQAANAAADGQRDKHLARHRLDHVDRGLAVVRACGDVEEGDLVGALLVVARRHFDRVAGVADVDEIHALDHATVVDVEAGNDALGQAHRRRAYLPNTGGAQLSASSWALPRSRVPSYSERPQMTP